jgi:hypothetical protein
MGVGFLLYKLLNQGVEVKMEQAKDRSIAPREIAKESSERAWVKELAQKESRSFVYPVNELFMQIDLQGPVAGKVKSFRLVIDRLDRYSLFCIVQTLTSFNLSYMIVKEEKAPLIYVQEKNEKALEKVLRELEKYDIKSKIVEVLL